MSHLIEFFLCAVFSVVMVSGLKSTVTLLSFKQCPVGSSGKELDYTISVEGEGENKFATLAMKLNEELNNEYTYKGKVDAHNGVIYEHFMDANGILCESMDNRAKEAFQRMHQEMVPSVTEFCRFPPGEYKLDKFTIAKDEIRAPISTSGQFKAEMHVYDPSGVERACVIAEVLMKKDQDTSLEEED